MTTIRLASPTKAEALKMYEILREMHQESNLKFPPIDPEALVNTLGLCYNAGKIWLAEDGDKLVGLLGVKPEKFWFSKEGYLADTFFYVSKESRGGRTADRLLEEAEKFSKELKLPFIMAILNGLDVELKGKWLERRGFEKAGGYYIIGL